MEPAVVTMVVSVAVRVVGGEDEHLVSRRLDDPYVGLWQFPGGGVLPGETLEEAAVREVAEEIGIEVKIDRLVLSYIDHENGFVCTIFQSKPYLGIVPQNPEPAKHTSWRWEKHIPAPRFGGLQQLINRGILRGEP